MPATPAPTAAVRADSQVIPIRGDAAGPRFDGIGFVNGGGATSVLLKDYPEPQRSQILDLLYRPKFGASVSALLVEIPGDGNSTQGSMPSHMHARDDLGYTRGYTWWVLREARRRNPRITLDATAWSAPGWVGEDPATRVPHEPGGGGGDAAFWSQDAADYYVRWLEGLRDVYGLRLDAIGCRNEKGYSLAFAKLLRRTLNAHGFADVRLHAFDHWPADKFDFVKGLVDDAEARDAIDVLGAHVLYTKQPKSAPASPEVRRLAAEWGKPIWNTEEHVYKRGFDCAISIVEAFNDNYLRSGATKVVNWHDVAGVYPMQPYSEEPAAIVAHEPWGGHYRVREALWGYAHWGQFTEAGWRFVDGGACGDLAGGGTFVTLASPDGADFSVIVETKDATAPQRLRLVVGNGLPADRPLCVWRSDAREQFVQLADLTPDADGAFELTLEPGAIYSLSTTRGQQKGGFDDVPAPAAFPFPYRETFERYAEPRDYGHLPRYTADIAGAFELADRPDGAGRCIRQVVPAPTISWAPDWLPYTILGDERWGDYEVEADVWLHAGEAAGVMGRVNHVGTGYGIIPKGYYFELRHDGTCRLVVVRGKKDKKAIVGDAEQQAMILAMNDSAEGGEKLLAESRLPGSGVGQWHRLTLRLEGGAITGLVDGRAIVSATDNLYARGMAGLLAGAHDEPAKQLSTPFFGDVLVKAIGAPVPDPSLAVSGQTPIYPARDLPPAGR